MGYYSHFEVTASEPINIESFTDYEFRWLGTRLDTYGESYKWYDFNFHMSELSKEHPDVLFSCKREGEETSDIEFLWFRGGKSYSWRPDLKPPPFDESLLG